MENLLQGAEIKEGYLVSGDNTVMSFCRHENNAKNNFVIIDVDEKRLFCDVSVGKWLPSAAASHLTKLSKTIAEKTSGTVPSLHASVKADLEASPGSSIKKTRNSRTK